jgi:hypothetical protein
MMHGNEISETIQIGSVYLCVLCTSALKSGLRSAKCELRFSFFTSFIQPRDLVQPSDPVNHRIHALLRGHMLSL